MPTRRRRAGGKVKIQRSEPQLLRRSTTEDKNEREMIPEPWAPEILTAGKLLFSFRIFAALCSHITDCDEVFNYWEPVHFLVHGYGFQTWEYSPAYALRSYLYVWFYAGPVKFLSIILASSPKILQFYLLRCWLAILCTLSETYFYKAVYNAFGPHIARLVLFFLLSGIGPFMASVTLLPSTFAMYATLVAYGGWLNKDYPISIFAVAIGALIGWPFFALLGVPIAIDLVLRRKYVWYFTKYAILSGIVCLVPSVWLDTEYFGKLTIAPLNIFLYNVFTNHGPDLYGTEPWSFYFVNGFLNFNVVFIFALLSLPACTLLIFLKKSVLKGAPPWWLVLSGLFMWALVFFTQPHKEERFLYPVYPLICLSAAVSLDQLQRIINFLLPSTKHINMQFYVERTYLLPLVVCGMYSLLCLSRGFATNLGYSAPMDVYTRTIEVANNPTVHRLPSDRVVNLCVGKEWYRFPSNFFLPSDKWQLKFIQSDFKGQLPKPYSSDKNATSIIPSAMNDLNHEEPSRYISISKCHYLVDLDLPNESELEPRYSKQAQNWTVMYSAKFLDASRCAQPFRSFYIPFLTTGRCQYVNYNLLQSTNIQRTVI